jgi:trehalose 6-phosphate phosphatase
MEGQLAREPKSQASSIGPHSLPPEAARWALFLDLDGTLIDIAATPAAVAIPPELPPLLDRLADGLNGALAVVSGRPISDIDAILAPFKFVAAGLHGMELRLPGSNTIVYGAAVQIAELRQPAQQLVQSLPGTLLEDKGATLALHYRLAPQQGEALRRGAQALIAHRPDLHLLSGKMVLEIKPHSTTKGDAVRELFKLKPFAGRVPVFVGDDVTDRDGFAAAQALGGAAVVVGATAHSDAALVLPDPSAVRGWLASLASGLEAAA